MTTPRASKHRLAWITGLAFVGLALSGCLGGEAQAASMSLWVKDDITDNFTEVHVTYTSVEVLPADADDWAVAFEGNKTIELLALNASTAKEKLADFSLVAGSYQGLRIGISDVNVVDHNNTTHALTVIGDHLQIAEAFDVAEDGSFELLVDFDLEASIDAETMTFTAEAGNTQRSDRDSDGDGIPDIEDADDDNDGIEDAQEDDIDGNGEDDRPEQSRRGFFGLCTAWFASENGRSNGNATNSTAFQHLQSQAAARNQTVETFCDQQKFPGPPEHVPAHAQDARERRGPPEGRGPGSDDNETRGPPEGRGPGGNQTNGANGNRTNEGGGNQTNAQGNGNGQGGGPPAGNGPPAGRGPND